MLETIFFKISFGLYLLALVFSGAYLFIRREVYSRWVWRLYGLGLSFHLTSFVWRTKNFWEIAENRFYLPINTFFGALSYLAFAIGIIFWLVEGRHRLNILGAFVLPWSVLAAGAAMFFADPSLSGLVPSLQSYWINIHPLVLMTAYAFLANAFGVGVALLIQEHQVKSRKPSELCYRLPAIEELDQLQYRLIAGSFPILSIGIVMGGIWAYNAWGRFWGWDAKETWALITWFVYVGYLHLRLFSGWRGRKTVYLAMLGFACVIFTFFGVNYLSELHGYLSGG
ncbi:MAG: c-type cytochrome biogenesis protein CcsB [Elusimicrobia bacterium]|nr:c-type cytochrome biogenesis protein CcsB [Elusimicrobiota bacterium]